MGLWLGEEGGLVVRPGYRSRCGAGVYFTCVHGKKRDRKRDRERRKNADAVKRTSVLRGGGEGKERKRLLGIKGLGAVFSLGTLKF